MRFFPLQKPSWVSVMVLFGRRCGGIQECPRGQPVVVLTWKKTQPNSCRTSLEGHWCCPSPLLPFCLVLHNQGGQVAWLGQVTNPVLVVVSV